MKLKTLYMAVAMTLVGGTACTDYLELTPRDSLTQENFFQTSADAEKTLVGVYEALRSDFSGTYYPYALTTSILSDDAYAGGGGPTDMLDWQNMGRFQSTSINGVATGLWNKNFRGIQRANTFLSNFDKISFKENEATLADNYLGETTFLRAHYYFELARFFENVPMPEVAFAGENWTEARQATPQELYAFIAAEMQKAIPLMAETNPTNGRLSRFAAKAELLKVFMFYTGYYGEATLPVRDGNAITRTDALAMAEDIINNSGAVLVANYADLFNENGDYNSEALFEIVFANTFSGDWGEGSLGNIGCQMAGPRGYNSGLLSQGWGFGMPSHTLDQAFEAGDLRKATTIITAKDLMDITPSLESSYTHTGMYTFKYTTHASRTATDGSPELNYNQNYHYIRLADVILLAAELELAEGDAPQATAYVNQVRARAGLAPLGTVDQEAIMHERRVELAFEGHRYFDLLRQGLNYAKSKIDVTNYTLAPPTHTEPVYVDDKGNNLTGDIGDPDAFNVNFDLEKRGFLAIPQSERDLNPNLTQNAGY